jgi:uncharacterized protein YecT (DUF1311 family)
MKEVVAAICVLMFFVSTGSAQTVTAPQDEDCSKAATQNELNECSCKQFRAADAEMNRVYGQLLYSRAKDRLFIAKLKNAQRTWLVFRDAHLASLYPDDTHPKLTYGSAFPMCWCMIERHMTEERTKELKKMLNPKEGDVCGVR